MTAMSTVSLTKPLYIEEGNQLGSFGLLDLDNMHANWKPPLFAGPSLSSPTTFSPVSWLLTMLRSSGAVLACASTCPVLGE
jgi:hypothetical protein